MTTSHFGAKSCVGVKIQRQDEIQTTVLWGGYMAEDGAFRAQKRCGSKPLSTTLKSRTLIVSYLTAARGHPLIVKSHPDPEEGSTNEQGLTFVASKPPAYSTPNP
jgi:hypothetical protein